MDLSKVINIFVKICFFLLRIKVKGLIPNVLRVITQKAFKKPVTDEDHASFGYERLLPENRQ